ncbi:hypothetical protein C8R44DRAFT_752895 [Mycena epipterygia]|nr:hypothetical protein C8R44DRAFT_752895 [Mycena epipterygia]
MENGRRRIGGYTGGLANASLSSTTKSLLGHEEGRTKRQGTATFGDHRRIVRSAILLVLILKTGIYQTVLLSLIHLFRMISSSRASHSPHLNLSIIDLAPSHRPVLAYHFKSAVSPILREWSYSRLVISGGETVVVQIAVLRVALGNPWLARPPNPAEPRLADARRWAALAAHGLDPLAAASRHLAGTSGYLWIGGAVGIRSLNAVFGAHATQVFLPAVCFCGRRRLRKQRNASSTILYQTPSKVVMAQLQRQKPDPRFWLIDLPNLLNTIPGALLVDSAPNFSFPGLPLFTLSTSVLPRRTKFALGHVQAHIAGVGNYILDSENPSREGINIVEGLSILHGVNWNYPKFESQPQAIKYVSGDDVKKTQMRGVLHLPISIWRRPPAIHPPTWVRDIQAT